MLSVWLVVYGVSIADNFFMDKQFIKKVGKRIKFLREEKNLSQEELACDANVSRSTISMIETAQNDITLTKIKRIAVALGVEPYELLKF
jgi:transcriptional regulator with XRE-family HTH domain